MKSQFLKVIACLMLAGMFQFTSAQTTASKPAPASSVQPDQDQVKRANDLTDRIAGEVQLTSTQKTKLQAAMKEAIAKYTIALQKARKEDESKLSTVNSDLIADILARIKVILTPDQFNTVMSKENNQ